MTYLVIGPTNLDVLTRFAPSNPQCSQTIGGKGYNIAKNLAVFNQSVYLSTILGTDEVGSYLQNQLAADQINLTPNSVCTDQSLIYTELLDSTSETITRSFTTERFAYEQPPHVDWEAVDVCIVLSSVLSATLDVLWGIKATYPDMAIILEFAGKRDNLKIAPYLGMVDLLIGNEAEFERLATDLGLSFNSRHVELFTAYGIPKTIETQSRQGTLYAERGYDSYITATPLDSSSVMSSIGAGDSVTATVAYLHYGHHYSLDDAIRNGMSVATEILQQTEAYLCEYPQSLRI